MPDILPLFCSLFSSHIMFPNTSLATHTHVSSKGEQETTVDIDAIMDNISIVLYTLTIVIGITGNCAVIWVAGFKLKVDIKCIICFKYFLSSLKTVCRKTHLSYKTALVKTRLGHLDKKGISLF